MRAVHAFTVPGTPVPKQRPRRNARGVWYTPAKSRAYEKAVGAYALAGRVRPTSSSLRVSIALFLPDRRRRDVDNMAKSILDGLNGTAFDDDDQVVELNVTKQIDRENPRAEVTIEKDLLCNSMP